MKFHDNPAVFLISLAQILFFISLTQQQHKHPVKANGGFYYIRDIILIDFLVEVLHFLFAVLLMVPQVEVGTGMNTFHFFKTYGEVVFYITSSIVVVRKFYVVVETVFFGRNFQGQMPFHPLLLHEFIPLLLGPGSYKKLHLHLIEFHHPEDKQAVNNLIPESLANLGNTKGY